MENYQNRSYIVQAQEMTWGKYVEYRALDKAQHTRNQPDDKGFLVINPYISERNVDGVDGYVSWLPEQAFHEVYYSAIEPDDKDVVFVKVNDSEVYGIADATKHFADLLSGYNSSTAQISLLESDDAIIGSDANGNQKNLIEMLAIQKASWKERHGKCWTGDPLLICYIDEED